MKSKRSGKKVLDIAKPKKAAAATAAPSAPKLNISKRSIMVDTPDEAQENPTPDIPDPAQAKRVAKVIEPANPDIAKPDPAPEPEKTAAATPEPKAGPEQEPAPAMPEPPEKEPVDAVAQPPKPKQDAKAAAEDVRRQQQIQSHIENKDYFVPINAVARKRSLKVSIVLTFVELVLGVFLINLMLDAGLIQLLEKIPHTNFFGLR